MALAVAAERGLARSALAPAAHYAGAVSGSQAFRCVALWQPKSVFWACTWRRKCASSTTSSLARPLLPPMGQTAWEVHKFGGASLANAELYRTCGDLLISESTRHGKSVPTAAVVSAMKGMTDRLIAVVRSATSGGPEGELAAQQLLEHAVQTQITTLEDLLQGCDDLINDTKQSIMQDKTDILSVLRSLSLLRVAPNTMMEWVAGTGEIWSAQTLHAYLKSKCQATAWLNTRGVLIVESKDSGMGEKGAALDMGVDPKYAESAQRLEKWWREAGTDLHHSTPIMVVTGFNASTEHGVPTTLKRSGSDFSATIFAHLLQAASVTMWKNVDGVFTADPNVVPEAVPVKTMNYDEAVELAYFGGEVLHPSAMLPCMVNNIPVHVRNIFNPSFEGTKITGRGLGQVSSADERVMRDNLFFQMEKLGPAKGITAIKNVAMVNVEGGSWAGVPKVLVRVMSALDAVGVKVVLVTQASSEHSICLAVDEDQVKRAVDAIRAGFELELARGDIDGVHFGKGYSVVAVVGDGMKSIPGFAAKIFAALGRAGVNIVAIAQGSSERNISVVLGRHQLKSGMRAMHAELSGEVAERSVSVGVIGNGRVGGSLLEQIAELRNKGEEKVGINVRAIAQSKQMLLSDHHIALAQRADGLSKMDPSANLDDTNYETFANLVQQGSSAAVIVDCTPSAQVSSMYPGWLQRGISVVTANKNAGCAHMGFYRKLKESAAVGGANFKYEATVGAGLPIIWAVRNLVKTGDEVISFEGILSATMTHVLNSMSSGRSFSEAVADARMKGFTEPDLRDDLSGVDMQREAVILARECGLNLSMEDVSVENLVPEPLRRWSHDGTGTFADGFLAELRAFDDEMENRLKDFGDVMRYVCSVDFTTKTAQVALKQYAKDHPFCAAKENDNIVLLTTKRYQPRPLVIQGPGSGPAVTAGAVLADLLNVAGAL